MPRSSSTTRWCCIFPFAISHARSHDDQGVLGESQRGMADTTVMDESTVIADRPGAATTGAESIFAEVLAGVLRVDRVSVDSHFFDDLGADSLVMAHFCARVRKRRNLPPVSMKDVYAHPTIRSLAAAVADAPPRPRTPSVSAAIAALTPTSTREYVLCGTLQALCFLAYSYAAMLGIETGYTWISAGSSAVETYLRLVLAGSAGFFVVSAVPIAATRILVGRWQPQRLRLMSLASVPLRHG